MTVTVKWYGPLAKGKAKQGAARGLFLGAEHVLEESRRLVPIEEGTLERSGVASVDEGQLRAAVSYDTVYAVYQHEMMNLQHDAGRTSKYLESPLFGAPGKKAQQMIADEIKKALG